MTPSCLGMDIVTYCVMQSSKQPEVMLFGYFQFLTNAAVHPIGVLVVLTTLSKVADNSTNYSLKS